MRTTLQLVLVLSALALPMTATADEPPPVPEGGLWFYAEAPCRDNDTGQEGYCYFGQAKDGRRFMTFYQHDVLMFIRQVLSREEYEQIWTNPLYVSV